MNFLRENFEVIVVLLFLVTIAMSIFILSLNKYFALYFSNKKFQLTSGFQINALDGSRDFVISIYNRNINDVRISSFGYIYKGQNIDFYQSYLKQKGLPIDHKVVISSRDFLNAKIDMNLLKDIVSDINKKELAVYDIKAYVTDALGLSSYAKAKQIQVQVHNLIQMDIYAKQEREKKQKELLEAEARAFQEKERQENKLKRQEKMNKFMLGVKGRYNSLKGKSKQPKD